MKNCILIQLLCSLPALAALNISEPASYPATPALENTAGASSGNSVISAGNSKGQTHSFSEAVELTGVVIKVGSVTTASDLKLEIYSVAGGLPSGVAHFSDTGTMPATLVSGDYLQIDFPAQLDLAAGDYAIVLESTNSNFNVKLNKSDGYAAGRLIKKNSSSGNAWATAAAADDFEFALLGSIGTPVARPVASAGPNIIFILADDAGWTDHDISSLALGHQSDFYQTPNLARLASEGVSFTSAYAQPNCAPTRAALMTGQYSPRVGNGVYNVTSLNRAGSRTTYTTPPSQGSEHVSGDADTVTVGESFYNSGYVTAHFGKYHVGSSDPAADDHPLNQGFDYNYGGGSPGNPGDYYANGGQFHNSVGTELDPFAADYTSSYISDTLAPYNNGNDPSTLDGTGKHLTDAMGDAFISFMDSHQAGAMAAYPVYTQLHFYAVHSPIQGRADLVSKYQALPNGVNHSSNGYAALLENMDHSIGRILDYLDDPNGDGNTADSIADNTLVIFTSDNGGQGPTSNVPLRGRKGMHYQGGIRVPLIARMPNTIPAGKVSNSLVHCVDYYPTMLDFASGVFPNSTNHPLDGESLQAHVLDPDNVTRDRTPIFYHFPGYMDSRAYACSAMIKEVGGKHYKYIYAYDPYYEPGSGQPTTGFDQYQLYNLTDDISESINLMDYIDEENASDSDDPSSSREYWDYIQNKDLANQMASELNSWLVGEPDDTTWNPIYATYKSNFPGIDPDLIGQSTGPAPASVADIETPGFQSFRVTESPTTENNNITLTFSSEPGFTYQIQGSSDLQPNTWDDLGSPVTPTSGTSTTHSALDPDAVTNTQRFYRIRLLP